MKATTYRWTPEPVRFRDAGVGAGADHRGGGRDLRRAQQARAGVADAGASAAERPGAGARSTPIRRRPLRRPPASPRRRPRPCPQRRHGGRDLRLLRPALRQRPDRRSGGRGPAADARRQPRSSSAFDDESWVEIKDGTGAVIFSRLNPAGAERGGERRAATGSGDRQRPIGAADLSQQARRPRAPHARGRRARAARVGGAVTAASGPASSHPPGHDRRRRGGRRARRSSCSR